MFNLVEVSTSYGMTINLGNYETMRVDAGNKFAVKIPEKFTEKEKEKIMEEAYIESWFHSRKNLRNQVKEIRKAKGVD